MNKVNEDRRRISLGGLLDSAIRTLTQLIASNDMNTRTLAIRALAEVQQARRLVPSRRVHDLARSR